MDKLRAIVIGGTGLVGSALLDELLEDDEFESVLSFGRRKTGRTHEKLTEHVIDFEKHQTWRRHVQGEILFCALGTTAEKAGSQEEQTKVDHTYQYQFAKMASINAVHGIVLVSTMGADYSSNFYYLRIKGELESDVRQMAFKQIQVLRPSLLLGDREEPRKGEKRMAKILKVLNSIGLFRKYRPLPVKTVARAMIAAGHRTNGEMQVSQAKAIEELASEYKEQPSPRLTPPYYRPRRNYPWL